MSANARRRRAPAANQDTGGVLPAWLPPAIVAGITCAVFSGILQNGFVNWDDDTNLLANPHYRGLGWTQISWMFTTFHMAHYQPLTWLTLAMDYTLWGMDPKGYHLTSLLLHALNAVVFYLVALRLLKLGAPRPQEGLGWRLRTAAAFAALVFSIHPLRVEAVAWATGRRDILSGLFYLLALLYYLKAHEGGANESAGRRRLAAAAGLFLVSLLSKEMGLTLPAVLVFLDICPLRRLHGSPAQWLSPQFRRVWLEKIPFVGLSLAAGVVGLAAQVATGATRHFNVGEQVDVATRLLQPLYGVGFYLWKTLAPFDLLPLYERPYHSSALDVRMAFAAAAVVAAGAALVLARRRLPALAIAGACYLVTLLPVLQIVPFGPQIVADRYSYLACLGWAVLAGYALLVGLRALSAARAGALLCAAGLIAAGLGLQTWRQAQVWRRSDTLWRSVLAVNPDSSLAHSNLGSYLMDNEGKVEEAAGHFRQALRIRPEYPTAHFNLGNALALQGRTDEAMGQYRQTLELDPDFAGACFNLGNALLQKGRIDEAIALYRQALRLQPDFADAHNNLGALLLRRNETGEAIAHFREALRLDPAHELARNSLANALRQAGQR